MVPKHLTWVFAGLFVLLAVLAAVTDVAFWQRVWSGLSILSLGGFAVSMARDALATGRIRIQYSVIRYATQPWLFTSMVVIVAATGVVVLIGGVWVLFFKS